MMREKQQFREDEAMPVVTVPGVVVGQPVDVGVPPAIVAVDVENRDALCRAPSVPPPFEYSRGCI